MANLLLAFGGLFIILAIIVLLIVFLIWYIKLRKIKKNIPKIDLENPAEVHKINFDPNQEKKKMYRPIDKLIIEKEVIPNEKNSEVDKLERQIQETEREIQRLRESKGGVTGAPVPETRESPQQHESVPDSSPTKATTNNRRNKRFRWKPIGNS